MSNDELETYKRDNKTIGSTTGYLLGFCPKCGCAGKSRERRPDGNDKCVMGHSYKSKDARAMRYDVMLSDYDK